VQTTALGTLNGGEIPVDGPEHAAPPRPAATAIIVGLDVKAKNVLDQRVANSVEPFRERRRIASSQRAKPRALHTFAFHQSRRLL